MSLRWVFARSRQANVWCRYEKYKVVWHPPGNATVPFYDTDTGFIVQYFNLRGQKCFMSCPLLENCPSISSSGNGGNLNKTDTNQECFIEPFLHIQDVFLALVS